MIPCPTRSASRTARSYDSGTGLPSHLPPRARSPSLSSIPALPGGKERLMGRAKPAKEGRSTTMIYTHVLNRGPAAVRSPADRMFPA